MQKPLAAVEFRDIIENFPLKGEYVFRAKFKQGKEVYWLDLDKSVAKMPSEDGAIWLKVKRVAWEKQEKQFSLHSDDEDKPEMKPSTSSRMNKAAPKANTPAQHIHAGHKPIKKPSFNFEDVNLGNGIHSHNHSEPSPAIKKQTPGEQSSNMMDLDIDLSGMGTPASHKAASKQTTNLMDDFLL